jgi:hypothetical protein
MVIESIRARTWAHFPCTRRDRSDIRPRALDTLSICPRRSQSVVERIQKLAEDFVPVEVKLRDKEFKEGEDEC